jgi:hypothetical protein
MKQLRQCVCSSDTCRGSIRGRGPLFALPSSADAIAEDEGHSTTSGTSPPAQRAGIAALLMAIRQRGADSEGDCRGIYGLCPIGVMASHADTSSVNGIKIKIIAAPLAGIGDLSAPPYT